MNEKAGERINDQAAEVIEIGTKIFTLSNTSASFLPIFGKHKQYPYNHGSEHVVCKIFE
jgi:hypothetical protein